MQTHSRFQELCMCKHFTQSGDYGRKRTTVKMNRNPRNLTSASQLARSTFSIQAKRAPTYSLSSHSPRKLVPTLEVGSEPDPTWIYRVFLCAVSKKWKKLHPTFTSSTTKYNHTRSSIKPNRRHLCSQEPGIRSTTHFPTKRLPS